MTSSFVLSETQPFNNIANQKNLIRSTAMFNSDKLDFHYIDDNIKMIIKSAGFKKQNYDNQYIHI